MIITLEYGGKNLKFSFGLGFLGELLEVTGLDIDAVVLKLKQNPFRMIPLMMYYSTFWAYRLEDKELDFTLVEFINWVDKDGGVSTDKTQKFLDSFTESLNKDVPKEKPTARKKGTSSPKK